MEAPDIGGAKPILVTLERKGKRVFWCACGRSKSQPFCDGSHKGTPFTPLAYVAKSDGEEVLLCACKRTCNAPFCDGSHNSLSDTYAEADDEEIIASANLEITPPGDDGRAILDGGAFVLTPNSRDTRDQDGWRMTPVITKANGADKLSQLLLEPQGDARALQFGESEVVVFIARGEGEAVIGGRRFEIAPECAFAVRPGEAFSIDGRNIAAVATVCPHHDEAQMLSDMPANFDSAYAARVGRVDAGARQTMGDRFYQVLIDERAGSDQLTQFIGEIPKSRASAHRHLYEEAILILSGEGFLWTERARAAVRPGDIIYLPRKQLHSLEATSAIGMRLAGAFYPAGSPAVNY